MLMGERRYYSARTGCNPDVLKLDLDTLKQVFLAIYSWFKEERYFQEVLGYKWDDGNYFESGTAGRDINAFFVRKLRKQNLWPIEEKVSNYLEDDLFDVIELLHDVVSKPVESQSNAYFPSLVCAFDTDAGRLEFRAEINRILRDYCEGYQLSEDGEVLLIGDTGLESLLEAEVPEFDPDNIDERLKQAVLKYRRYKSSDGEKREAVRALADILEYLKKKYETFLVKADESDLFQIANRFGIRHHEPSQNTDYDAAIWLPWMFYVYLASIHLSIRLIQRANCKKGAD